MDEYANVLYRRLLVIVNRCIGHREVTSNFELHKCASRLMKAAPNRFLGVFAADRFPSQARSGDVWIANLDTHDKPGSHWVGVLQRKDDLLIYDSFGRSNGTIFKGHGRLSAMKSTDRDAEQKVEQNDCGQRSLAWILLVSYFGQKYGKYI
jgi:hypothetical protein